MEMLDDFNIEEYLDINPPNDNSVTTANEIKELSKIPIQKNFVKQLLNVNLKYGLALMLLVGV